jgi:hypothetical protein
MAGGKWRDFRDRMNGEHVKAFDWSQFDSSVRISLILSAVALLRTPFPDGVEYDRAFTYIASSMINKAFVDPDGSLWRIDGGVPSGHPFTSLVDSAANWLLHRTVLDTFLTVPQNRTVNIAVCGDDTLLSFMKGNISPTTSEYIARASEMWGISGRADATSDGFLCSSWEELCLPFLGTRFVNGLPGMGFKDYLTMDLGDRKPRRGFADRANELWVYQGLPPFNLRQTGHHIELCEWLIKNAAKEEIGLLVNGNPRKTGDIIFRRSAQIFLIPHVAKVAAWEWTGMPRVPFDKLQAPDKPPPLMMEKGAPIEPGGRFVGVKASVFNTLRKQHLYHVAEPEIRGVFPFPCETGVAPWSRRRGEGAISALLRRRNWWEEVHRRIADCSGQVQ